MIDKVNHPSHYAEGRKYEPIKVIQDWNLDFCLGNTVKYISRAGRKSSNGMSDIDKEIEDLKKALFYLEYRIKELEAEKSDFLIDPEEAKKMKENYEKFMKEIYIPYQE